jgi:hypothetical protein
VKRAAIAAVAILLVVAVAQWRQQGGGQLQLKMDAPSKAVTLGEAFDVKLAVDHMAKDEQVAAFDIVVNFDPAILQVDETREGDYLAGSGRSAFCPDREVDAGAGTVRFVCGSTSPRGAHRKSSGVLGVLVFRAIAAGDTTLRFGDSTDLLSDFGEALEFRTGEAPLSVSGGGGTKEDE